MEYEQFIESKRHRGSDFGITPNYIPDQMFDFQKHVAELAIKKGRCACFLDTGLGKTIIELTIGLNYVRHTNKPILIITPLAVAFQFIKEAEKFGIDDVEYSKDGRYSKKIIVCNYERLEHFSPTDFDCVLLDESSILKNFDGATKDKITEFLKRVKYRYLFTATPSPNDYIELGTSSEALGYMGYMDMLGKFFKNNQSSIDIRHAGSEWYLKAHAETAFWQWVASWSIAMRKPSDLGFSDALHKLPALHGNISIVNNEKPLVINGQHQMFNKTAFTFQEIKAEVRATINKRCEKAYELASKHDTSVYWVNLNDEADLILSLDKDAYEVRGNMDIDKKEEILLAFSNGEIKKLVTKTSITAFGLNWQHCNHTTYFPTFSYEQYYQAIRRFYRFGQKRDVIADLVISDGQSRVLESLQAKKEKADSMFQKLSENVNSKFQVTEKGFNKAFTKPKFIN